jgi:N-acetylglucosaminyldiphosphoundecaprenol N-acetyl-beta-D-mannosaminyltransferase
MNAPENVAPPPAADAAAQTPAALRKSDWSRRQLYALGGLAFDAVDLDEALMRVELAILRRERLFLSTPNTNFLMATQHDAAFRRSVLMSDLVVPDGMPIVWMARLLGLPVKGRVTGADLFEQFVQRSRTPAKVFFFGGPEGAAQTAAEHLNARGGVVHSAGALSPGFGSMDSLCSDEIIDCINASHADFLVVALGAKRGQEWIVRNLDRLNVPVISHLGAVVNFEAGNVRRAPSWMQKAGLEWAWRIREEPALARRYAVDGWALLGFLARVVVPSLTRNMTGRIARPE